MNVREWALPVYTILMQMAVGALLVLWLIRSLSRPKFSHQEIDRIIRNPMLVIAFTVVVAMGGAHFHLSRPFHSYLAILNFRSSWLSREIVFTVLFFLTAISLLSLAYKANGRRKLISGLGWLAIALGAVLIYCMARIYLLPTQAAWNSNSVILSFYITSLMLGGMAIACLMVLDLNFAEIKAAEDVELRAHIIKHSFGGITILTCVLVIASLIITYAQVRLLQTGDLASQTSFDLLTEVYLPLFLMRIVFISYAAFSMIYTVYRMYRLKSVPQSILTPVFLSCLFIIIGEIIGRFLFYATHIRVGL